MAAIQRAATATRMRGWPFGARTLLAAGIAFAVVVAGFQVHQFSRITSRGYEIDALNRELAARRAENYELEAEVAQLSSLARVEWEARVEKKMEAPKRTLFIDVNAPVPARDQLPTRFEQPQAQPEAAAAGTGGATPFWQRLAGWLLPF
jgi:cell division protein FtsL